MKNVLKKAFLYDLNSYIWQNINTDCLWTEGCFPPASLNICPFQIVHREKILLGKSVPLVFFLNSKTLKVTEVSINRRLLK